MNNHMKITMNIGSHRLWAHKSFKARLPLKVFLLFFQTMTLSGSVLSYARDHRVHHKWPDQEPDVKNSTRGLFFAHSGWWLLKKKQAVKDHGNQLKMDDLYEDRLLVFQHRYYIPLAILLGFVFPTTTPWLVWNESPWTSFLVCACLRIFICLHHYFAVNSLAHEFGTRPFDKSIKPTQNTLVNLISLGEGSHNYHHTFAYDYRGSEKKFWEWYNPTTVFIKVCHLMCLAYDLKRPSHALVVKVARDRGCQEYIESLWKMSIIKRIFNGLFTWALGIFMLFWPIWIIMVFKIATGRKLISLDRTFEPYLFWLKELPLPDNFVVCY